ncbi:MAG: CDP-diacylglycerol--glycerol-3-phosphate 3-phosphatidyltransferase [Rhodobacteraceae bacterium]|jgi:CDP-diacylglycerol--glycerol-3-phosphate 3-phosphatidyltransferase|nr:CDP-diacylglycerol--glycerol-3-phosphate 3-phosphatidyltransferase [Paracoccaceae bacterium]
MLWTLPNLLTVLRLFAAPLVPVLFLFFHRPWADWLALALFLGAAVTDYFDGYLARLWKQQSRFGAMLDPIADKVMVVIALALLCATSGLSPWMVLPATAILFREIFVAGLREFLGEVSGLLKVTPLAKWKTTLQMVSIGILFLATGLVELERGAGAAGAGPVLAWTAWLANAVGLALLWVAAGLTVITGADYFAKALPHLRGGQR